MHTVGCFLRRAGIAFISLFVLTATPAVLAQSTQLASWQPDIVLTAPAYPFTFVGYGDIRFTDPANTHDSSPQVRRAEVARIAQEKPAFVIISGDLVLSGSNARDWKVFDAETAPLRHSGIELFASLGNHDVLGGEGLALRNFFQRFPQLGNRRWYSIRIANTLVFVLDSTSDDRPGSRQGRWLHEGLDSLPPDVDFVLIALHHPRTPVPPIARTTRGTRHVHRNSGSHRCWRNISRTCGHGSSSWPGTSTTTNAMNMEE